MASKETDPLVPWGYGKKKIRLSEIPNDPLFKSLEPNFAANVLRMITENPSIGIGGADREEAEVLRLWKERYAPTNEKLDINDPKIYKAFSEGKYKEYQGKIYKLKKDKSPSATPNASWHSGGFAVDLIGNTGLAGKVAKNYGINQVTSTGENWHFQPAGMPDGRRVIDFLKSRYNLDINEKPLQEDALKYINENFSSNAPSHPASVLAKLDSFFKPSLRDIIGSLGSLKELDNNNPKTSQNKPKQLPKEKPIQKGKKAYGSRGALPANGRFSPHSNIMPPRLGGY
jgi:hypothetical protein